MEEDAKDSNNLYKLLSYKELTAQIAGKASNFKDAGITKQQMVTQLSQAEEVLGSMNSSEQYEMNMRDVILENVGTAKNIVESTYNTSNINGNIQGGGTSGTDTTAN